MYTSHRFILTVLLMIIPMQTGICSEKNDREKSALIIILDAPESEEEQTSDSNLEQLAYEEPQPLPEIPKTAEIPGSEKDPRINDLEKSITEINVYQELNSEDNPENDAGRYLNSSPVTIREGDWVFKTPNRYPICFCHLPLYYEEINLERCGRGYGCIQPVMSSAHFLKTTVCLPVEMIFDPPCELVRSPGDCLCCQKFKESHH